MLRPLLLVIGWCGAARAQPKAVSLESTRASDPADLRREPRHGPVGLGIDLAFGWAGQRNGPSGWSARLDYEVLPLFDARKVGAVFGFLPGFEVWRSGEDNWGFSMPLAIVGGVRVFPFRATLGGGVDALLVDQVDDDTGFGMYAPFALAKLGLDVFGVQLGVDARIGYRWQLGADDHTRWQLSFYAGYTASPRTYGGMR